MEFGSDYKRELDKEYTQLAIPEASVELQTRFKNKEWRNIPIREAISEEPKHLVVVPNRPEKGRAMAWPAYYKTVKEGLQDSDKLKGFGELAQAIEGVIQKSPIVKVRPEVKDRLDRAQELLDSSSANLQLVLVDGYRQLDVQKRLFDAYHGYVASQHPELTAEETRNLAIKMVSEPPADVGILRKSPPPHSTGGSADVVLVYKDKIDIDSDHWLDDAMVPFGAKFDEMMDPVYGDERSETVFYERKLQTQSELSPEDRQALENRRILYNVMTEAGFTNYHTEFWHYDFGNQFNASASDKKEAEFGFAGGIDNDVIKENTVAEQEAFQAYQATHGSQAAQEVRHHFGL